MTHPAGGPVSGLPGIREWMGAAPMPWPPIESLHDGDPLTACYYVEGIEVLRTRHDKAYLKLRLCDRRGTIDGRIWDDADAALERIRIGTFVGVRGRVQVYQGRYQLKIEEFASVQVEDHDLDLFLPRSERDLDEMERELERLVRSVRDRPLRTLLRRMLDPAAESGRMFRRVPAASRNHHAYVAGLLEHTLSVTMACDRLAQHYGAMVDRDLLVTGALLHDIGKTRELEVAPGFPYTTEGRLLGHIVIGLQMVAEQARNVEGLSDERCSLVLHLIASHQGRYEWQSPREPSVLEALILHYADDLDAKFNQVAARVHSVEQGWTGYDRSFGREFYRHLAKSQATRARREEPGPDTESDAESPPSYLDLFGDFGG